MDASLSVRAMTLTESRTPYVHAVVVRAQVPASACTGDEAIILADGSLSGFVGGQCAEGSVRAAAVDVLATGRSILLRVLPAGSDEFPDSPGARIVVNPCLSGGALEIFLKPVLPPPVVEIVGSSPIAQAVEQLCAVLGYATRRSLPSTTPAVGSAVVIASHGHDEPDSIRTALEAGVSYIALVASARRGKGVLDEMALTPCERARISTPAGLDLGASTAAEVGLSIMAEVVRRLRNEPAPVAQDREDSTPAVSTAIDPVCGMRVVPGAGTPALDLDGETIWFCCVGCRDRRAATVGAS